MEGREVNARLKKGFWKPEEDLILKKYVETHGEGKWSVVSKKSGKPTRLMRAAKSCRLRWKNYLRPNIKRGMMSEDEKDLIIRLHKLLGNRWSLIAGRLPGRTDNEVKNYWNTHLNKRPSRAQIQETPAEEDNLATAATAAAEAAPPNTNIEGENLDSGTDSWIENLTNGDYYGINMHPDYEAYNYMPIFDNLVYSDELIMQEETIFDLCSLN